MAELSHRFQSLNEINSFLAGAGAGAGAEEPYFINESADGSMNNSWNYLYVYVPFLRVSNKIVVCLLY